MAETDEHREQREVREAEQRGAERQKVASRLDGHDRELSELRRSLGGVEGSLRNVSSALHQLTEKVTQREVVSEALTKAAQDAVARQVSRREFWLGVGVIAATIIAGLLVVVAH